MRSPPYKKIFNWCDSFITEDLKKAMLYAIRDIIKLNVGIKISKMDFARRYKRSIKDYKGLY